MISIVWGLLCQVTLAPNCQDTFPIRAPTLPSWAHLACSRALSASFTPPLSYSNPPTSCFPKSISLTSGVLKWTKASLNCFSGPAPSTPRGAELLSESLKKKRNLTRTSPFRALPPTAPAVEKGDDLMRQFSSWD